VTTQSLRAAFKRTPFVGREAEVDALKRLLDEARGGSGALVAVSGEPGIGKSRLAEELAAAAREAGFVTLAGHCYEGNATAPYTPLVEAIETAALARDAVAGLLAQLIAAGAGAPERELAAEQERHALFTGVRDLLSGLGSDGGVLLVIEDLHWAGVPLVLLLRYLAQFVQGERVLVLGTLRSVDPPAGAGAGPSPAAGLLEDLRRLKRGYLIELAPLSEEAVGGMLAGMTGRDYPAGLTHALYAHTEGNPFFVEEVVKHLLEEGRLPDVDERWAAYATSDDLLVPDSVRQVIDRRLEHISDRARRVLTAAAVIGRTFDYELLSAIMESGQEELLDCLDEGVRARLLISEGAGHDARLSFAHELIRQSLLAQISAPRRQRLHLRVLEAIEARHGDLDERIAELAHHSLRAGGAAETEKTIRYATRAAERAMAATAYEEAARLYRYALRLVPFTDTERRCEMTLRLGVAEKRISDSEEARQLFTQAAELARQLGDAQALARAALGFAPSWATIGREDEAAVALLREAEQALGDEPTSLRAQVLSRLAGQLEYSAPPEEVRALSRQGVETARRSGDPVALARALQTHHVALWEPEFIEERMAAANEILEVSRRSGIQEIALWSHRPRIADFMTMGRTEEAERELAVYTELAGEYRQPIYTWQAAVRRCMLATFRGRLQEAERRATEAFAIGQRAGGQNLTAAFGEQMLIIRWLQGRLHELEPLAAASHKGQPSLAIWRAVLAFIYVETGREAEARRELEDLSADGFARLSRDDTRLIAALLLAVVAARVGDANAADDLYEELLPHRGRNMILSEGVTCVGATDYYLAALAATTRRWTIAERHFQDAIEMNAATGAAPWVALAQFDYGSMLLARRAPGDRRNAAELFAAALARARELGMASLVERAERMLASRKRLAAQAPDGLTPREVEVLRLIAAGRSNKEISEALVLSLRTAARHVTNIYAKIGAHNRADAAAYAIRNGLAEG
jgi:DNA-binding CsgD family transcriptional regulator